MSPVRDAMRLIYDEQTTATKNPRQHVFVKVLIGQTFRRNEQNVDPVAAHLILHLAPMLRVGTVYGFSPYAHPPGRLDLIAHQSKERGDQ